MFDVYMYYRIHVFKKVAHPLSKFILDLKEI